MKKFLIAPSILSADFANLGQEVESITNAGADMIHIDIMDGSFVPNLTIGPDVVKAIRKYSNLPFDVHLMVENPEIFIKPFADAGADYITVHLEAVKHLDKTLNTIKTLGVKAGISLLPSTAPESLEYIMDYLDLILVMTVNPGFGGQQFLNNQLPKIEKLRKMIDKTGKDITLSVDGGVNTATIQAIKDAGANMVVAGSYIFSAGNKNYKQRIQALKV
jgi:ribulose-phosphate 3-epimerase